MHLLRNRNEITLSIVCFNYFLLSMIENSIEIEETSLLKIA